MPQNEYVPFSSEIKEVIRHTQIEYTFRMAYAGKVKPGQFFEVSIPKFGEAPISVSGTGSGTIDLTIRKVGLVTDEVFERYVGERLFLRGPYGNGFDLTDFKGKEIVIIAGGTGLSPVKGLVDYFANHPDETLGMTLIAGFKSPNDILFKEDLKRWKKTIQVILTVDDAQGDDSYQVGLVTQYIPQLKFKSNSEAAAAVVGPPMMMKFAVQGLLNENFIEKNIWISQERKMCCGVGRCGHCKIGSKYVCLDGPVFNYAAGKNLVD
ncbi:anaerobic sulfite reductase subunit AsrB [Faecalispora anaeroviscerum]|uniref:anaerobic sulfite reductase subunit AsrB n=1 Tax=Faecalispora anaeroviscerum TaxID=2991836 RepID=UPI0024BA4D92|nr:anaerobic sulfite reductase subunit AsrB [Faecalispora anaeroviscerum]